MDENQPTTTEDQQTPDPLNNGEWDSILQRLRRILQPNSTPPQRVPKNYAEQFEFSDDGTTKSVWAYISNAWTQLNAVVTTTKGDLSGYSTGPDRVPVGADGQVLSADSSEPTGLAYINANRISLLAGENLTAGDIVAVGNGLQTEFYRNDVGSTLEAFGLNVVYGQMISCIRPISLSQVIINLNATVNVTATVSMSLYADSGGLPTGAPLQTRTFFANNVLGDFSCTFNFSFGLTANTNYHLAVTGLNSSENVKRGNTASNRASKSTTGGALFSGDNGTLIIHVKGIDTIAGRVYKANAKYAAAALLVNILGFAVHNAIAGSNGLFQTDGVQDGLTLTPGMPYYLSDMPGAISTASGTNSRKIGLSVSSTQLLIKHDN